MFGFTRSDYQIIGEVDVRAVAASGQREKGRRHQRAGRDRGLWGGAASVGWGCGTIETVERRGADGEGGRGRHVF